MPKPFPPPPEPPVAAPVPLPLILPPLPPPVAVIEPNTESLPFVSAAPPAPTVIVYTVPAEK